MLKFEDSLQFQMQWLKAISHISAILTEFLSVQIAPEYSGLSISQNSIITTVFQTNPFDFSFSIFNPQSTQLTQFSTAAKSMGL